MIQRIQTLYLAVSMILLTIVSMGVSIINFVAENEVHTFSVYGWTTYDMQGKVTAHDGFPYYIITIGLILLIFLCIMSYKKLAFQLKIGRLILVLYFLSIVGLLILTTFGADFFSEEVSRELGAGYLIFVLGLPFIFLANIGVKRDKKLLDSLNRLR